MLSAWTSDLAGDRPVVVVVAIFEHRGQLRDVVALPAGEGDGKLDAAGVDEQMVLRAAAILVDQGWPSQEPPKGTDMAGVDGHPRPSRSSAAFSFTSSFW